MAVRMTKRRAPEKLYRIGEVMEHAGLTRQTVQFYTALGLIREAGRTASGYRLYPSGVFATLERIRALQEKGWTLERIRESLESRRQPPRPATAVKRSQKKRTPRKGLS